MTDERITAYLLEELTEQESEQFEEQCFAQEEWPEQLDAAEQELIDAYLRNELTSDRKRRFQERYLTTDTRKARVLAAESFHETLCPVRPKPSWREWLKAFVQRPLVPQTAIAILVLAVGLGIFLPGFFSPPPQTLTLKTFKEIELAMSSSNRAGGPQPEKVVISLPLDADALRIHLKLPEASAVDAGYRVQLENVNGPLRELKIESQDAQSVIVIIPAAELSSGQFLLKLSNKNDLIGNYFFTAEARTR
jgi:hypothetical protein